MPLFGPSRAERHQAAAHALAPYGFTMDPRAASEVRRYFPSRLFSSPDAPVTAVLGQVDGCQLEAYEYDYSYRDSDGNDRSSSELLLVAHHPSIEGGASFAPDHPKWGGAAAVLDVLFWVPPFTILKAFQLLMSANNPDRSVGHAEFDRLYLVRADSDEAAARAVTPALRDAVTRMGVKMSVELRPGHLICSPHGLMLDERASSTIGIAVALLSAFSRPGR